MDHLVNSYVTEVDRDQRVLLPTNAAGGAGVNAPESSVKRRPLSWVKLTLMPALWEKKMPMWSVATLVLIGVSVIVSVLGTKYATKMAPCPEDGWIWSKGKCYYFSQDTTDWKSSQEFCSSKGSSLAILNDPVVLETSFRFKDSSQDYWIGLKITVTGHQEWQWVDGSSFENEVELSQSDGPALDCVCLNSKKAWNLDCASQRPWICVKEAS